MSAAATSSSHRVQEEFQTDSEKSQRSAPVDQEEIARIAYALWQSRGCPDGSPEQDWFAAEEELRASYESPGEQGAPEKIGPSVERGLLNAAERIA